jgi:hypothetical protein
MGAAPTAVVVQIKGNGTLGREEAMMAALAASRGIPVERASEKQLERRRILLSAGMVAVGSVPFVKHALRQFGKELPLHAPYPTALGHLLYRDVRKLPALSDAHALLAAGRRVFIKPADGWKRFTGFVAEFADDYRFNGVSRAKPVWVSDPVRFVSEWRAYVADNAVMDVRFADHGGDRDAKPDISVIREAVALLAEHPATPAGYVIDFGVLDTGETALIEMNDGFSFGAYDDVTPEAYWSVTVSRWQELVA